MDDLGLNQWDVEELGLDEQGFRDWLAKRGESLAYARHRRERAELVESFTRAMSASDPAQLNEGLDHLMKHAARVAHAELTWKNYREHYQARFRPPVVVKEKPRGD